MNRLKLLISVAESLALRLALQPMKLLPVKKDTVLFVSFRGKQYSCNPRYISEELEKRDGCRVIWAFHEPEKFRFLEQHGIKVVGDSGFAFWKTALTARVVVTNTYYKPFLPRRKKQFFLRTWHGGGAYKRVDYPKGLEGFYIRLQQQGADLYLSSSEAFTRQTLREVFGYTGPVLEKGMPRNDMLVNGDRKQISKQVRKELSLGQKKIALYAPTYRDDGRDAYSLDGDALLKALKNRFGGEWVLLTRGHHALDGSGVSGVNDVTAYPDMQPLLAAADVLVTDYSSSMWDMSLTGKPVFLYCADLSRFKQERDFFTDIRSWPFPLAEDNAALEANILSFDEEKYAEEVKRHHAELGSFETGHAASAAADAIQAVIKGE